MGKTLYVNVHLLKLKKASIINPIAIKESMYLVAPAATISNLIGWSDLPTK